LNSETTIFHKLAFQPQSLLRFRVHANLLAIVSNKLGLLEVWWDL